MSALTKKKSDEPGPHGPIWRVYHDGVYLDLLITKCAPPKFGRPQMWDVFTKDGDYLFEAKSLDQAMFAIARVLGVAG